MEFNPNLWYSVINDSKPKGLSNMDIGRLQEVDVRSLWKHEQYDFSNWLAQDENIELLNEVVGLTLVDVTKEVFVGSYRCDLVAKDEGTDTTVIIENQLECSNHDHLGKIITYASGLSANVIIWIVKEARAEHRSAIEWLNNNTNQKISFFLLELHAYTIGDSMAAPKFEIIEMPNDFIKTSKVANSDGKLNKSEGARLEFWTRLNEVLSERGKPFNPRKPSTDHWYAISLGTSAAALNILLVSRGSYVGIEIYIGDNKALFDDLFLQKDTIEQEIGFAFEWLKLDNKKASRILYKIPGLNFDNHSNYDDLMNQAIDGVMKVRPVFMKYLQSLKS